MDVHEEDRIVTALRAAGGHVVPGVSDRVALCEGGFFGQVLRLIKHRQAAPEGFRRVLEEVVGNLDQMSGPDLTRWREFLHYIHALLYHSRGTEEQNELNNVIDRSIVEGSHQKENAKMGQTIAEAVEERGLAKGLEKGMLNGLQSALLRQLRKRFKKVPRRVEARISDSTNVGELQTWLDNVLDAKTLADVGIPTD